MLITPTPVTFDSEGEAIRALLYHPAKACERSIAVVVSPSRVSTIEDMDWLAKSLASRGYVVLVQGYRSDTARYQLRDVTDVRNAVSHLGRLGHSGEVVLVGHSRGASASLRATAEDSRVRATVALSPPVDVERYMTALRQHSPSRFATLTKAYGGSPEAEADYYRKISPIWVASRITTPVLLVHGTDDMVAPREHSEWMLRALRESGNRHAALHYVDGAGHFFEAGFRGYCFDEVVNAAMRWIEQTLRAATRAPSSSLSTDRS